MNDLLPYPIAVGHRTIGLSNPVRLEVSSTKGIEIGDCYFPAGQNPSDSMFVVVGIDSDKHIMVKQVIGEKYVKNAIEIDDGSILVFSCQHPQIRPGKIELS